MIPQTADLLRRGFRIFPIQAGKKFPPLVKNWPAKASDDPAAVEVWEKQYPGCNWGIHTEGMVVLDVDKHKGGEDSLFDLEMTQDMPKTLESRTPSGGLHIFYTGAEVPNSVERVARGIDVRSTGGYVVAPGSRTPGGDYAWNHLRPTQEVPPWLPARCAPPQGLAKVLEAAPDEVDQEIARGIAAEYLNMAGPPEHGNRDAGLIPVAAQLKDIGVSYALAYELMSEWAAGMDRSDFPDEQFEKCIRQGFKTKNSPGSKSFEADANEFEAYAHEPGAPPLVSDDEMYRPGDVHLGEVLKTNYLVKGWLDRGSQALLFGRWGAGKTFNALNMCAHIAAGEPWNGQRVRKGGVLYFGYEGAAAMKRRIYAMRQESPDWDWDNLPFFIRQMHKPLAMKGSSAQTAGQEVVERAIATFKERTGSFPDLVLIDPLRNALNGSDSDPELTGPYLTFLQKLTRETGCTTLTLHHPGHGDADRSRGDSGIEAHMDTVIRVDGDTGQMDSTKQRDGLKGSLYYNLRVVTIGMDDDGDAVTTCVVEQVRDSESDPALTEVQRALWVFLRDNADDDGTVKKAIIKEWPIQLIPKVRDSVLAALTKKKYLFPDGGAAYTIGQGPALEVFNELENPTP